MKLIFKLLFLVSFSSVVISADLTLTDATVTRVQVYETSDDSLSVWLHLNGNTRVGPNPANENNTCELWTHDKTVHSIALAALMSGKKVTVKYKDRGEGTYWCDVVHLSVHSN